MGPWIRVIDEGEAEGALAAAYKDVAAKRGKVANIVKVQSLLPETIGAHLKLYTSVMFGPGPLARDERELVAVVVSNMNDCEYCVAHHAEALNRYWKNDERVRTASRDFRKLPLPKKMQLLLEYAEQLTHKPLSIDKTIIAELREAGASDEEILQVTLITGYFNFVNRVALGLGVTATPDEIAGYAEG